jgi:hypothetical protein
MHFHKQFLFFQYDLLPLEVQLLVFEVHFLLENTPLFIHISLHFVLHGLEMHHLLLL